MLLTPWLKQLATRLSQMWFGRQRRSPETRFLRRNQVSPRRAPALSFERLEDRTLLATFTVNTNLDNTTDDTFLTLREAIEVVNDGDHTDGVAGLGGRNLNAGELAQIDFTNPLGTSDTINFDAAAVNAASEITLGSELSITSGLTINGNGPDSTKINGNGATRLVNITGGTFDVGFNNLTLTYGYTSGSEDGAGIRSVATGGTITVANSLLSESYAEGGGAFGGGLFSQDQNVTITNSMVTGNRSGGQGGGLYLYNGTLQITGSALDGNRAEDDDGGAIYSYGGNVTINDSLLSNNYAYEDGGAIQAFQGSVTLTNSAVINNEANSFSGGGIYARNGNVTITRSLLSGNEAENDDGGAIWMGGGDLLVTGSTISGNYASNFGGGIYADVGDVTLTNSTLSGNEAGSLGGAVYSYNGNVALVNSTISGNMASDEGGGIYTYYSALTVVNSTISGNSAGNVGAGISIYNANAVIHNTIVAGNTSTNFADINQDAGTLTVFNSLIGDNQGNSLTEAQTVDGNGNFVGDSTSGGIINPMLAPLQFNGGPTQTHALLPGSLALNSGSNALAETLGDDGTPGTDDTNEVTLTNDQRGLLFTRFNGTVDMGAVEDQSFAANLFVVDNATDEFDGDLSDGDRSLREVIALANGNAGTDTVTFDPGIDTLLQQLTLGQIEITESVVVQGNGQANTIIDGNQADRIFEILPSTYSNVDVTLDSLTLQNGRTTASGSAYGYGYGIGYGIGSGGAIRNTAPGTLTISNSIVTGNSITGELSGGGAIFSYYGDLVVNNSTLTGNSTSGDYAPGGAILGILSNISISNSTLTGNSTSGFVSYGGAVAAVTPPYYAYFYAPLDLTISGSDISDNHVTGGISSGGGIAVGFMSVSISGSTLNMNTATEDGGAIGAFGSEITIRETTISGNQAGNDGGGIFNDYGYFGASTLIVNSTISGNEAGDDGGGVHTEQAPLTVINSTISGNIGFEYGGGLYGDESDITLVNSTVTDNTALRGGGVDFYVPYYGGDATSTLTVHNSIIAGNNAITNPDFSEPFYAGGPPNPNVTVESSLIGDNTGTGLTEAPVGSPDANSNLIGDPGGIGGEIDPLLGPLQDNGGPTFTHALLDGSPAIGAGDDALALDELGGALANDQRQAPFFRIFGTAVDMGAFEAQPLLIMGDTAFITGTDGDDSIIYRVSTSVVKINGVAYRLPDNINSVQIDGGDGNDTLRIFGTSGNDSALSRPEQVFFEHDATHDGFDATGLDVETVILEGEGGDDSVTMRDTAGNDKFFASQFGGVMFGADGSYQSNAFGFDITGLFSTGDDLADFSDSAAMDVLSARPDNATFQVPGLLFNVQNFDTLRAASTGGGDLANLFGTAGSDALSNTGSSLAMTGVGFTFQLDSFDTVNADGLGGTDLVRFNGSDGDDTLIGNPDSATFMTGGATFSTASFENLIADAVSGAADLAVLTDSVGNDLFSGVSDQGELSGTGFFVRTFNFDTIRIRGVNGGANTRVVSGINYQLVETGTWV